MQIKESIGSDSLSLSSATISIYFSYCDKKDNKGCYCKGCHNSALKDDGIGYLLSKEEIIKVIDTKLANLKPIFNDIAIVFLGGEPLASINRDMVIDLSKYYKNKDYSTIIYTWRYIEDIKKENIDISYFDKIICGEYIDNLNNNYILGSTNQYVIDNKFNKIIEYTKGENKCI